MQITRRESAVEGRVGLQSRYSKYLSITIQNAMTYTWWQFSSERRIISECFSMEDLRFLDFASVLMISFEAIKEGLIYIQDPPSVFITLCTLWSHSQPWYY